jgi:signal transduction histidine kinase/ActR/RegA family two-component response regulator
MQFQPSSFYILTSFLCICTATYLLIQSSRFAIRRAGRRQYLQFLILALLGGFAYLLCSVQTHENNARLVRHFLLSPLQLLSTYFFFRFMACFTVWGARRRFLKITDALSIIFLSAFVLLPRSLTIEGYHLYSWGLTPKYSLPIVRLSFLYLTGSLAGAGLLALLHFIRQPASRPSFIIFFLIFISLSTIFWLGLFRASLSTELSAMPDFFSPVIWTIFLISLHYLYLRHGKWITPARAQADFDRLRQFIETGVGLSAYSSRKDFLKKMVKRARRAARVKSVSYYVLNTADSSLCLEAHDSVPRNFFNTIPGVSLSHKPEDNSTVSMLPQQFTFFQTALESPPYLLVDDIRPYSTSRQQRIAFHAHRLLFGIKAYLLCLVRINGKNHGLLMFGLPSHEEEYSVYPIFANQVANILTNFELLNSLRTLKDQQALLLNAIEPLTWNIDADNCIGMTNRSFQEFFGCGTCIGKLLEVAAGHQAWQVLAPLISKVRRTARVQTDTAWLISGSKTRRYFRITLSPGTDNVIIALGYDITRLHDEEQARRELEGRLVQADKLQAVGQLAGGIAHDFNNNLTAIMGYAELLKAGSNISEKSRNHLDTILSVARRSAELTAKLLAFARQGKYRQASFSLHELLLQLLTGFHERPAALNIQHTLNAEFDTCHGDPDQVREAIKSIMLNASEALQGNGNISLTTCVISGDAIEKQTAFTATARYYIDLTILDNGPGIPADVMPHIFEPFFTTKDKSRRTGMGLSATYGTIRNHRGTLQVTSEPGIETAVHLYLPLVKVPDNFQLSGTEKASDTRPVILVVDDEEDILELTRQVLSRAGYRVIGTENGEEALLTAREQPSLNLAILDMLLPDGDMDLLSELRRIHPRLPVIFASGYGKETMPEKLLRQEGVAFLAKPFSLSELRATVESCLGADSGTHALTGNS